MAQLIPAPDLDLRDEEKLAAEAIARVSGGLTVARIDQEIETLRELRMQVQSGVSLPICPELTNANPSAPHTVLLEAQSWLVAQLARRINLLPLRDQIEFARLFGVELRESTFAKTNLTFTVGAPSGVSVTIPKETEVSTADGIYSFLTDENLIIPAGSAGGSVSATRTVTGKTLLSADTLKVITDPIAYVTNVTNPANIESGTDAETIEQALNRARNYQRRGERLVSAQDFEDAIREDLLFDGIVKVFPFISNGNYLQKQVGHTTIVLMTKDGVPVGNEIKQAVNRLMTQQVGNQFIYVIDPSYVDFDVTASVAVESLVSPSATVAGIEQNLRDFYAARRAKFGVSAMRSEIISVIEGSEGVDHIVAVGAEILSKPAADVAVSPFQLVRLIDVSITVV